MIASVNASTVAYCAAVNAFSFGAALARWIASKASAPSSEIKGRSASVPALVPIALSIERRLIPAAVAFSLISFISVSMAFAVG